MEDATQCTARYRGRRPWSEAAWRRWRLGVQEEQQLQHPVTSAASAASRVHHVTGLWESFHPIKKTIRFQNIDVVRYTYQTDTLFSPQLSFQGLR